MARMHELACHRPLTRLIDRVCKGLGRKSLSNCLLNIIYARLTEALPQINGYYRLCHIKFECLFIIALFTVTACVINAATHQSLQCIS